MILTSRLITCTYSLYFKTFIVCITLIAPNNALLGTSRSERNRGLEQTKSRPLIAQSKQIKSLDIIYT